MHARTLACIHLNSKAKRVLGVVHEYGCEFWIIPNDEINNGGLADSWLLLL